VFNVLCRQYFNIFRWINTYQILVAGGGCVCPCQADVLIYLHERNYALGITRRSVQRAHPPPPSHKTAPSNLYRCFAAPCCPGAEANLTDFIKNVSYIHRRLTWHDFFACVAGSKKKLAWRRKVMYRTDCGTVAQCY
jgi:hypothetical protein